MTLSRDSLLALQRHFFGALSAPARTWLEPLPASPLAFSGSTVRSVNGGCVLDFGSVESPGEEHHTLRVSNRGAESTLVRLTGSPPWLAAQWSTTRGDVASLSAGDAGAAIDLTIVHDAEGEFTGSLRLAVDSGEVRTVEELPVRMLARRSHPQAQFDFNGSPVPRPHDFGEREQPYELAIANKTSIPLVVRFADLPAWLVFEVDGHRRSGPLAGPFFERIAPFTVRIAPHFVGRHRGSLRIETNDRRTELQTIELAFTACVVPSKPHVRAFAPQSVRIRNDRSVTTQARLENWGRFPARTQRKALPASIDVPALPIVPAAYDGNPGTSMLSIRISPAQLGAGDHQLTLKLGVDGGEPAEVDVPLHVEITRAASTPGRIPPEMVAALVTLLLLAVLFAVLMRGLS